MRYPLEGGSSDFVAFTPMEYRANSQGGPAGGGGGAIILYMPPQSAAVSNQNDWGEVGFSGPIGELRRDAGAALANNMMTADFSSMDAAKGSARRAIDDLKGQFENVKGKGGQAVRQLGVGIASKVAGTSPNQLLAMSRGEIFNPNVELLYQGPKLRSFSFNFQMVPKSAGEAQAICDIVKYFKQESAPRQSGSMYKVPKVWQISYSSQSMNQFKPAACTAVTYQTNPGLNMHMSFPDGMPIITSLALSFTEVDVILAEDHTGRVGM